MTAEQTRQALNPGTYLNAGNYVDAIGAYQALRVPRLRLAEQQALPNAAEWPRFDGNLNPEAQIAYIATNSATAFLGGEARPEYGAMGQLATVLGQGRLPAGPTSGVDTRPVSRLEDDQTRLLRDSQSAVQAQSRLATELVRVATEAGNTEMLAQARSMANEAQAQADRISYAITVSEAYRGHAFTSDADALRYVELRSSILEDIQWAGTYETVQHQDAFTTRSDALYQQIRAANDGTSRALGGSADLVSEEARIRFEARLAQSRTQNLAASEHVGMSGITLPNARIEQFFYSSYEGAGERGRELAYYARLDAIGSRYNERGQSIDDLPTPARTGADSPARTPSQGRQAQRDAAGPIEEAAAQPRQPGGPDYPQHIRTAEERAAYDRRRAAEALQRDTLAQEARQREYEEASRVAAEAARREAARIANERARIAAAAAALAARDARWSAMVQDRFRNSVMEAFEAGGGRLTVLELEAIYAGYDPRNTIPPAQSLSSVGTSISSMSELRLSSAGTPVRSGTDDFNDPAVQSLYEVMYGLTQRRGVYAQREEEAVQTANFGDYDLYADPTGRYGRESGGYLAASLFSQEVDYLTRSVVNGRGGLTQLLAQPFNVLLTWGSGAFDLDLHLTGPTGIDSSDRFHIYYAARGNLTDFPFAELIRDCICASGSEVVLTSNLLGGGVYRVSVFNFGDQSATSTNLANQSNATISIVRGGTAVSVGNGTTIEGGRVILTTPVPNGQFGNTWIAAELDPATGRITVPRSIDQSEGSADVH